MDYAAFEIRKLYQPEAMGDRFLVLIQAKGLEARPDAIAGLGGKSWKKGWKVIFPPRLT
ncbi:hypothetical protein D3C72_2482210 [compost metagenome]